MPPFRRAWSSPLASLQSNHTQILPLCRSLKESGSAFGEVALMGDDCIRSASVIADLPTDLMVIDRDLYNRSIKEVLKEEFDQKYNFILGNPYFNQLNAKYKKQLAMALEKETLPYEKVLANQGGKIDAIHFILSGEAAVMMDVDQHSTQYPNLLDAKDIYSSLRLNEKPQTARTSLRTSETSCSKKGSRKVHKIGICLLGINEAIGDIEVLLGLNTYMQTCICTQPTEVLVMGMKHYDRLLIRRNPKVLVDMRKGLELRIASRIANQRTSHIPLLASIKNRAEEFNFDSNEPGIKNQRNSTERLPAKVKKGTQTKDPADTIHPQNQQRRTRSEQNLGSGEVPTTQYGDIHNNSHVTESRDSSEFLAHVALEELERKMSEWMATGDFYVDSAIHSNRTVITPRITKMHRGQTEPEQMKPGAKVLIRPNKSLVEPIDFGFEAEHGDPKVYKAPARTEKGGGNREFALENQEKDLAELAYYKMALTAPCPIFDNDYEEEEDLTSYDRS